MTLARNTSRRAADWRLRSGSDAPALELLQLPGGSFLRVAWAFWYMQGTHAAAEETWTQLLGPVATEA